MDIKSKADAESWLRVAEVAIRQDENTPEAERMSCRTLVKMVIPLVRTLAEVLS